MPASTYLANKLLDHVLRGVAYTPPTKVYVSLHTGDPGLTGANEVTTGAWPAYAREEASQGGAVGTGFEVAAAKATSNALEMLWAANDGASTITLTHFGLWDAATGGNFLGGDALTASKTIGVTDETVIHANTLDVDLT